LRRSTKRFDGGGGLGVEERDWLVISPSLVSSAVEAILAVLYEEVVDKPRAGTADVGERSSGLDSAMMARVNRDSRREFVAGRMVLLYMASLRDGDGVGRGEI
jgi:hypothetical protein